MATWGERNPRISDFLLFTLVLWLLHAFLLFKSFQLTHNNNDLHLSSQIIKACDSASLQARFWGAAHGLSGIMYVLMHFDLPPDVVEDIKNTLKYMIKNRFPSGNYPSSEEENTSDLLVNWCHRAPGMALTLVKAAEIFEDKEFLEAAIDAAEIVWNRGLLKRVGLCHGISGNAYVFLALFRLTGNVEFLNRAKAFACFLLDRAGKLISEGEMHGGDNRYSLFEEIGGFGGHLTNKYEKRRKNMKTEQSGSREHFAIAKDIASRREVSYF